MVDGHRVTVPSRAVDSVAELLADSTPQGAFVIDASGHHMLFTCPCGCDQVAGIEFPKWTWDGNRTAPTVSPSIKRLDGCKWHGFLRNGVWEPCSDSGK